MHVARPSGISRPRPLTSRTCEQKPKLGVQSGGYLRVPFGPKAGQAVKGCILGHQRSKRARTLRPEGDSKAAGKASGPGGLVAMSACVS